MAILVVIKQNNFLDTISKMICRSKNANIIKSRAAKTWRKHLKVGAIIDFKDIFCRRSFSIIQRTDKHSPSLHVILKPMQSRKSH